jgi:hypothetical protein
MLQVLKVLLLLLLLLLLHVLEQLLLLLQVPQKLSLLRLGGPPLKHRRGRVRRRQPNTQTA